jgi:hypothetical protein
MNLPDDCGCKVDYVSQKRGLQQLDARIRRRREDEDYSLRDLEAYVNARVLWAAMVDAGMNATPQLAEDYYRRLTDGDDGSLRREETRRRLREAGVDVDELTGDFVCYQTVRKHLNECLDISTSTDYEPDPDASLDRIRALRGRAERVAGNVVDRLSTHGALDIGEFDVMVGVKVRCSGCGRVFTPARLFEEGGCGCDPSAKRDDPPRRPEA